MASLNYVVLAGNLTRDPQVRTTPGGTAVADLGVAINEKFKNKAGELQESTTYVDIVAWGRQAEVCQQYLHKGSPVLIEGRLQLDQWESKEGEKRSKLRIRADRVQFLSSGQRRENGGEQPAAAGAPPPPAHNDEPPPF
ncbi:MAG: single-stranded DNA-binding protein [Verrucomicrobia bacterium]|nr:MAG: single-stranded DNA-binding protein [Verrucomicrobiota bacterium]